jgi:chemotaxis protein MotB
MAKQTGTPIIIKKVKSRGGHGHHGGAWKVAYADFVTAMMAFFLLLWLLNVTTDIQKRGIADYFEPTIASTSKSGAGGVLGGVTIGQPGAQQLPTSAPGLALDQPAMRQPDDGDDGDQGGGAAGPKDAPDNPGGKVDKNDKQAQASAQAATQPPKEETAKPSDAELDRKVAEREEQRFAAAEFALRQAVEQLPDLKGLAQNLIIDRTPEGLRIQLVDQDKSPMFDVGSAQLVDTAKKLIAVVSQVVLRLPNKISITGHTDATPYPGGAKYTNWELSADRANASRREFIADGVPVNRITRIVGLADGDPLVPEDPTSARNRRISVVVLREAREGRPTQAAQR